MVGESQNIGEQLSNDFHEQSLVQLFFVLLYTLTTLTILQHLCGDVVMMTLSLGTDYISVAEPQPFSGDVESAKHSH